MASNVPLRQKLHAVDLSLRLGHGNDLQLKILFPAQKSQLLEQLPDVALGAGCLAAEQASIQQDAQGNGGQNQIKIAIF